MNRFTWPAARLDRWRGWLIVAIAVTTAVAVTVGLSLTITTTFLLLALAVAVSAWHKGLTGGLVALGASGLLGHLLVIEPRFSLRLESREDLVRLLLFAGLSALVAKWASSEKKLKTALQETTTRFRLVMENVTDYAIVLLDAHGRVLDWNAGAVEILQIEASDRGRSLEFIFTPEDRGAKGLLQEMEVAIHRGRAADERWHQRKDGSQFWGFGILTALRDQSGRLVGYVKIFRDFTPRKLQEEERHRLMRELEGANRTKDQMMAMLAHDLRAPLTAILGWTAILKQPQRRTDPRSMDKACDAIERNARQQLELMEQLLDASRIRSGHLELELRECDALAVLSDAIEADTRSAADAKRLHIEQRFETPSAIIKGDPGRLRQVFVNLLSNAVKFTPEGGRIVVSTRLVDGQLEIQVSDTGRGIDPQLLPRVFEPFRRGEDEAAGAGLGLTIVRELVERHHGTVEVSSEGISRGSTFTVRLPVRHAAVD